MMGHTSFKLSGMKKQTPNTSRLNVKNLPGVEESPLPRLVVTFNPLTSNVPEVGSFCEAAQLTSSWCSHRMWTALGEGPLQTPLDQGTRKTSMTRKGQHVTTPPKNKASFLLLSPHFPSFLFLPLQFVSTWSQTA